MFDVTCAKQDYEVMSLQLLNLKIQMMVRLLCSFYIPCMEFYSYEFIKGTFKFAKNSENLVFKKWVIWLSRTCVST